MAMNDCNSRVFPYVYNTCAVGYVSRPTLLHPTPPRPAQVPFGSIVVVLLIWVFISFPLCLFGTIVGRNWNGVPDNPCRWVGGLWAGGRVGKWRAGGGEEQGGAGWGGAYTGGAGRTNIGWGGAG